MQFTQIVKTTLLPFDIREHLILFSYQQRAYNNFIGALFVYTFYYIYESMSSHMTDVHCEKCN